MFKEGPQESKVAAIDDVEVFQEIPNFKEKVAGMVESLGYEKGDEEKVDELISAQIKGYTQEAIQESLTEKGDIIKFVADKLVKDMDSSLGGEGKAAIEVWNKKREVPAGLEIENSANTPETLY